MDGLIYAYHAPKSAGQRAYIDQRLAQLAAQRKDLRSDYSTEHLERAGSSCSGRLRSDRTSSETMETLTLRPLSDHASATSLPTTLESQRTMSEQSEQDTLRNPFELRHGRRYLRNSPYPLPCDCAEIQRQNLRTLLAATVFGRPVCSPRWVNSVPKKVLEVCCGSGYWSTMTNDYFRERGGTDVEFTGMDIAPLAPNYHKRDINWKFVQHDLRNLPLPFDDGEFDIVMLKDTSLVNPLGPQAQSILDDCIRLIRPGGTFEVWDSDYLIRSLPADSPPAPAKKSFEQDVAEETGTFAVAPGYAFMPAQNKYIRRVNSWTTKALDHYKFLPTPCVHYAGMLLQEEALSEMVQRRVAIPLGELKWERMASQRKRISHGHDSPMSVDSRRKFGIADTEALTSDQAALRHTALVTVLGQFEAMELMLQEASGKNPEDWGVWWSLMSSEMLDPSKAALSGECLEIGAWYATKVG